MAQPTQLGSIGHKGEQLAVKYLANKGFTVVDTNVAYKFGEIDVVAVKDDKYHFIEVKALSSSNIPSAIKKPIIIITA